MADRHAERFAQLVAAMRGPYNDQARANPVLKRFCEMCGHRFDLVYDPKESTWMIPAYKGTCPGCGEEHTQIG